MNSTLFMSPFIWAALGYLLIHALGSKNGTLALAGLHKVVDGLATPTTL